VECPQRTSEPRSIFLAAPENSSDDSVGNEPRSIFLAAPENSSDDSVGNEPRQSLFQLQKKDWLLTLPESRDENEGGPVDQPRRSQTQALSTAKHSQLAMQVLRRARMLSAPEQSASDPGEDRQARLAFLQSLPDRQGPPQRRRSAFSRICPIQRDPYEPEPDPESDPLLHLHQETVDAFRCFGLLPRDQGQPSRWDPDLVFPDPIGMNQSGDNPHETI
jgi:hypothetical protein